MEEAQGPVEAMLDVVHGWREFFMQQGVEPRSLDMLAHAMLATSFFGDMPPDAVYQLTSWRRSPFTMSPSPCRLSEMKRSPAAEVSTRYPMARYPTWRFDHILISAG
jgi:hypothetical protein